MKLRLTLLLVLGVVWLVPFYLAGAMLGLPVKVYSRLQFQYTAAGLFTRRVQSWNQTLFQLRVKGFPDWKTIDAAELSPMMAFGVRQRLDRILQDTNGKRQVADKVRLRLAEWIAREYAQKHPNEGEVIGVRMGQTTWNSNTPELSAPPGEWVRDPPDLKPSTSFRAYASFTIVQGKAEPELAPTAPTPVRTPAVFQRNTGTQTPKSATPRK